MRFLFYHNTLFTINTIEKLSVEENHSITCCDFPTIYFKETTLFR